MPCIVYDLVNTSATFIPFLVTLYLSFPGDLPALGLGNHGPIRRPWCGSLFRRHRLHSWLWQRYRASQLYYSIEGAFTYEAVKNTLDAMKSQGYITSFIDIKSKRKTLQLQKEALQRNEANTRKKGRSMLFCWIESLQATSSKLLQSQLTSPLYPAAHQERERRWCVLERGRSLHWRNVSWETQPRKKWICMHSSTWQPSTSTKRIKLEKEKIKTKEEEKEKEEEEVEKEEEEEDQTKNILFCINYVMYTRIIRNEIIIHYVSNRVSAQSPSDIV